MTNAGNCDMMRAANAREAVFFLKPGAYEIRLESEEGRKTLGSLKL